MDIPDCISADRASRSAWASELVSLAALAGDGITGEPTGAIGRSCTTTTPTSLTAQPSSTAITSIEPQTISITTPTISITTPTTSTTTISTMDKQVRSTASV